MGGLLANWATVEAVGEFSNKTTWVVPVEAGRMYRAFLSTAPYITLVHT